MSKIHNRSPLTPKARVAQQNLLRLWRGWRQDTGMRQADLAEMMGVGQSVVSQYLHGRISLNTDAVLRFADALGVSHDEIWPGIVPANRAVEDVLSPDTVSLAREIERLSERDRKVVQAVISKFAVARYATE